MDNKQAITAEVYCAQLERVRHVPIIIFFWDISSIDFHLFRSLEHWIRDKNFQKWDKSIELLFEFFDLKDRLWYRRCWKKDGKSLLILTENTLNKLW